jgi:predicted DNA binding CopG/RHH family protein
MNAPKDLKPFPIFETDEEAERFVAEADLSDYDFSGFKPARFAFTGVSELTMQVPQGLLEAVKGKAQAKGIPYRRYMRDLMELDVGQDTAAPSK